MKHLLILLLSLCSIGVLRAEDPKGNTPNDSLYQDAFNKILSMLEGNAPLDFKQAVYLTENAYLGGKLDYAQFDANIKLLSTLAMQTGGQEKLNTKNLDSITIHKNWGITRLFTDTFNLILDKKLVEWRPTQYNFDDPLGQQDWTNTFVSKLMETGKGNCHSLPYLYKIIAEQTQTKVSLVLAPSHMYLKAPTGDYRKPLYNIELTSKSHPVDGWIMATSYISLEATQKGLYMGELTLEESITLTLLDLAQGYDRKFPNNDEGFALKCAELALKYFPDCPNAKLLQIEFLARKYKLSREKNLLPKIETICKWLLEHGYDEMPIEMYADGLSSKDYYNKKGGSYLEQDIKNASPYGLGRVPTLTQGRYPETHKKDELERIGSIIFNRKLGKIHKIEEQQELGDLTMNPATVGRFLSVDPLASAFPWYTPYQFAGNTPIQAVDLEGAEEKIIIYWFDADAGIGNLTGDVTIRKITVHDIDYSKTASTKAYIGIVGARPLWELGTIYSFEEAIMESSEDLAPSSMYDYNSPSDMAWKAEMDAQYLASGGDIGEIAARDNLAVEKKMGDLDDALTAITAATPIWTLPFIKGGKTKGLTKKDNGSIYFMPSQPKKGGKPYFGKAENGIDSRYGGSPSERNAAVPLMKDVPDDIIKGVEQQLINLNGGTKGGLLANKRNPGNNHPAMMKKAEKWLNKNHSKWKQDYKLEKIDKKKR